MNALDQINSLIAANRAHSPNGVKPNQFAQSQEALQKAAKQFEAILLMQLTSALNGSSDDEDSLFGNEGGSSLAKQMFSEQMATTMSESGGVGLAEMMMRQFGFDPSALSTKKTDGLAKMLSAIKDVKEKSSAPLQAFKENSSPLIDRSARPSAANIAIPETFTGDPNDAMVVSTFDDQLAEQAKDVTISPLFREEKAFAATRARRVNPPTAVTATEMTPAPASSNTAASTGAEISAPVSFNFPVRGRISSGFGNRFHPIDKVKKFHTGLDIAVPKNTRVDAAAEGTVVFAGRKGGYGNLVIIRHPDGKETRYGHLEKLLVSEGETVTSRQQIALSGSTGKSTGPHLHFELRENGEILNPLKYLSNVLPKTADR